MSTEPSETSESSESSAGPEPRKPFLNLIGKVLLVAIPAAISGFSSYEKARVESRSEATASYDALKAAVEENQKALGKTRDHAFVLEGKFSALQEECSRSTAYLAPLMDKPEVEEGGGDEAPKPAHKPKAIPKPPPEIAAVVDSGPTLYAVPIPGPDASGISGIYGFSDGTPDAAAMAGDIAVVVTGDSAWTSTANQAPEPPKSFSLPASLEDAVKAYEAKAAR